MLQTPKKTSLPDQEYLNRLITEKEAADFLSFNVRTLQGWRVKGGGPKFIKVNHRSVRYRRRDLMEWIQQNLKTSTSVAVECIEPLCARVTTPLRINSS